MIMTTVALAVFADSMESPFIVPVAGCAMILGIVVAGIWSGIRNREIQSTERLAAIAKGIAVPPTAAELAIIHGKPSLDAVRRRAGVRLGGIVLLGVAGGLMVFFTALSVILRGARCAVRCGGGADSAGDWDCAVDRCEDSNAGACGDGCNGPGHALPLSLALVK